MVKYSQFSLLTGVSTDLAPPRPYPYTPLKMSSFGCEKNSFKSWIRSNPPPIKTKVKHIT